MDIIILLFSIRKTYKMNLREELSVSRDTCSPLPIMRLTALLPPPPTPTTLIFADSIEAKEQHTAERRRTRALGESHAFKKKGESGHPVEIEEEDDGNWVTLVAN